MSSAERTPGPGSGRHRHRRRATRAAEPTDAGHGHGHGAAPPASRRTRILLAVVLVPVALAIAIGVCLTWPNEANQPSGADLGFGQRPVHGEVTAAERSGCVASQPGQGRPDCTALTVRLIDGDAPGTTIRQVLPDEPSTPRFAVGDEVVLAYTGGDPTTALSYQVVDFQRTTPMIWLVAAFVVAVLLLGRWKGVASLAALGATFLVMVFYLLPAILSGHDPVTVGVLGAGVIMFGTLYLTHGFSARTSVAVLGTLISLCLIGVLGWGFTAATKLTGLDSGTANLIGVLGGGIDARGLLLAGVIIGALGVLDDVTVTQTSAVWELRRANPRLGFRPVYGAALRIGRDHIASAVNTLVLAYAGAALPVLLAYSVSGQSFGTLVTAQDVAQEVVRTLVGSIGLVAAVPVTTLIAATVAGRERGP